MLSLKFKTTVQMLIVILFYFINLNECDLSSNQNISNTAINISKQINYAEKQKLSRVKRYLAFPEGSSFSVSFCATLGFIGNPSYIYFSWAINWGVAYELPNETWILNQKNMQKPMPKAVLQRRNRRDLYERIETAINHMGYNGRQCVLRSLCESIQYFGKRNTNMVEKLIKVIFSFPKSKVLPFEHMDLVEYDRAHRKGNTQRQCSTEYPLCQFSLIELALNQYAPTIIPNSFM